MGFHARILILREILFKNREKNFTPDVWKIYQRWFHLRNLFGRFHARFHPRIPILREIPFESGEFSLPLQDWFECMSFRELCHSQWFHRGKVYFRKFHPRTPIHFTSYIVAIVTCCCCPVDHSGSSHFHNRIRSFYETDYLFAS